MKFIKGKYERNLRTHENITDYFDVNIGDYYLQYDYPNSFLVDLCQLQYSDSYYKLDDDDKIDISAYNVDFVDSVVVKTFDRDYVKN